MKNFIQHGDTITLTAPYDITSGGGVLVGSIFGIACNDARAGTEMEAKLTGVFSMQKVATENWNLGDLIYWNDTEKLATSRSATSHLIGVAIAAAASPSSIGIVRLNGVFLNATATAIVYSDKSGMKSGVITNSTNISDD